MLNLVRYLQNPQIHATIFEALAGDSANEMVEDKKKLTVKVTVVVWMNGTSLYNAM
jgi:phage FluMu gp28-like protein